MLKKVSLFTIIVVLVLASLPTANVLARGNNEALEAKWDQLVTNFDRQSLTHNSVHNWVEHWLKTEKKASPSARAEIQKHLSICNSAFWGAQVIVARHAGFDSNGKVVDRVLAIKSIKDLAYYLRQHAGSVKSLREHMN